jgi:hypothetical protein
MRRSVEFVIEDITQLRIQILASTFANLTSAPAPAEPQPPLRIVMASYIAAQNRMRRYAKLVMK